jgi:hypothetical protein
MAKRRSVLAEQWIAYSREMIESPALRVLSQTAIRVMHRLEAEHMNHGGGENGRLQVTYDQLHEWGMDRNAIAPAIRELVALGFVEITEPGYGGAEKGRSNRFRLTYVNSKSREVPTNEWSKIATLEKAESLASAARAIKDQRARDLGRRGARGRAKKYSPVSRSPTEPVSKPPTKMTIPQSANPRLLGPVSKSPTTIYISGDRGRVLGTAHEATAPTAPATRPDELPPILAKCARLPLTPPLARIGNPAKALNRGRELPGRTAPADVLTELEGLFLSNSRTARPSSMLEGLAGPFAARALN